MSSKDITLLVLAAGMGSRYGGLKQLDGLGPNDETILEYSIWDAVDAGFSKVVFVIRDFFKDDFIEKVTSKFANRIDVVFVNQPVEIKIEEIDIVERTKPWGTSHAVLVAKDVINEPFAVINADDYYGKDGFHKMAKFLKEEASPNLFSMIGYILENTLSDRGHVNRGICMVNERNLLEDIVETLKIKKDNDLIYYGDDENQTLDSKSIVSMNFWGFHHSLFGPLEEGFIDFVRRNRDNPKAEYFIPLIIDEKIKSGSLDVKVISSSDKWYGVTYKEDADMVKKAFQQFSEQQAYPNPLWS